MSCWFIMATPRLLSFAASALVGGVSAQPHTTNRHKAITPVTGRRRGACIQAVSSGTTARVTSIIRFESSAESRRRHHFIVLAPLPFRASQTLALPCFPPDNAANRKPPGAHKDGKNIFKCLVSEASTAVAAPLPHEPPAAFMTAISKPANNNPKTL